MKTYELTIELRGTATVEAESLEKAMEVINYTLANADIGCEGVIETELESCGVDEYGPVHITDEEDETCSYENIEEVEGEETKC